MFHKVVWQHMLGVVEFLVTILLQIYYRIRQWKNFESRLRFYRDIAMNLASPFLWNGVQTNPYSSAVKRRVGAGYSLIGSQCCRDRGCRTDDVP